MTTLIQSILKKSDLDYTTFTDSVSKFRVSNPESLIDTDFEYGLQSIKWETAQLVNNIPTFFSRSGDTPISLSNVTCINNTNYVSVATTSNHNMIDGSPFYIAGLKSPTAEGYFTITKVLSPSNFVYEAKYNQTFTGSLYIKDCSYLFPGLVYQGTSFTANQIQSIETTNTTNSTVTMKLRAPHGFVANTLFTFANTFGRQDVTVNTPATNALVITAVNHRLYSGMQLTYSSRTSGVDWQASGVPQTVGSVYTVDVVTSDTFRLIPSGSTIPITSYTIGAGDFIFSSVDSVTDGSDYVVTSVPDIYTLAFQTNYFIKARDFTFIPSTGVVQNQNINTTFANTISFSTPHRLLTGAQVITSTNWTDFNTNLANSTPYFAINVGPNTLAFASSVANAFAGTRVAITPSVGLVTGIPSTNYAMTSTSLMGEETGPGTVSLTNGVRTITGTNVNFLSYYKPGMKFRALLPATTPITYTVVASTGSNMNLSAAISTNPATNVPLRFIGTTSGPFVNSNIYYAQTISANQTTNINFTSNVSTPSAFLSGSITSSSFQTITYPLVYEATITQVINSTTILVDVAPTVTNASTQYYIQTAAYPFSDSYVYHRAFDGGIEMNPSNNADAQLVRQTRKYFRYQPGKGIQSSLSINFSAPLEINYLSRVNLVATATTRKPHRLTVGLVISVFGASQAAWNSTYTITAVTVNTFTFTMSSAPSNGETVASGYPKFKVNSWTGSRLRAGLYDDHNGMFFEYDGSNMYAVRRDSVTQTSGAVDVFYGSNEIIASSDVNTTFLSQLTVKQNVVIRGQTYRVVHIASDSNFFIQPAYRGVNEQNCIVSLVTDTRRPSTEWSIDKCDGTGPTGYILDVNKIQMIYMDYSWYGAGKIRFGFKDNKGVVRYVHEFQHNNIQDTAYFRSGNLPGRYEVYNTGAPTWVPPLLHWGTAVIMDGRYDDDKSYLFTANGNIINYTNGDTISILATTSNSDRTLRTVYDPYQQRLLPVFSITSIGGADTSSNSWTKLQNLKSGTILFNSVGASTSIVGTPQKDNVDQSRATIFTLNQPSLCNIPTQYTFGSDTDKIPGIIPLVSIRIAPSVDSSLTGSLGVRELVNHMQLRLKSVDILTTNDTELRVYLNSFISNRNFVAASPPSLSQYVAHVKGDTIQDGTILFSYRVPGGIIDSAGKRTSTVTSYDISGLGFLGNSIQGGDSVYPDGPDVLTIAAVCLDSGGVTATTPYTVSSRITWAEAQA